MAAARHLPPITYVPLSQSPTTAAVPGTPPPTSSSNPRPSSHADPNQQLGPPTSSSNPRLPHVLVDPKHAPPSPSGPLDLPDSSCASESSSAGSPRLTAPFNTSDYWLVRWPSTPAPPPSAGPAPKQQLPPPNQPRPPNHHHARWRSHDGGGPSPRGRARNMQATTRSVLSSSEIVKDEGREMPKDSPPPCVVPGSTMGSSGEGKLGDGEGSVEERRSSGDRTETAGVECDSSSAASTMGEGAEVEEEDWETRRKKLLIRQALGLDGEKLSDISLLFAEARLKKRLGRTASEIPNIGTVLAKSLADDDASRQSPATPSRAEAKRQTPKKGPTVQRRSSAERSGEKSPHSFAVELAPLPSSRRFKWSFLSCIRP